MTLASTLVMFGAMLGLAIVPDSSAMAVVARSMTSGRTHGLITIAGILAGDVVFILLAVFSLSTLAETTGSLFTGIKYLGGAYLLWLGVQFCRTNPDSIDRVDKTGTSPWASFLCGLFITLGDPKAILFYISFLPAFVELSQATFGDVGIILGLVILTVGGVKFCYALMGDQARVLFQNPRAKMLVNRFAGCVMIATGLFLIGKTI